MPMFLFSYRMPKTYRADYPDDIYSWSVWFQGLGANLVDADKPVVDGRTLGSCTPEILQGGYSLVDADDIDAAVELAGGCSGLRNGLGVEVGELLSAS
jgi:hypothetical protein